VRPTSTMRPGTASTRVRSNSVLRIETASAHGLAVGQDAVAADCLVGVLVPDQQVLAIMIETVTFDSRLGQRQARTHFFDKHPMAQALAARRSSRLSAKRRRNRCFLRERRASASK